MKRSIKLPFVSGVWPECPFTRVKRKIKSVLAKPVRLNHFTPNERILSAA